MFAGTHVTYPQRGGELSQTPGQVESEVSEYWTQDLSYKGPLLYQLSYPSQIATLAG